MEWGHHQDSGIGCSQFYSIHPPPQITINYSRTRYHWEHLEQGAEAESPPWAPQRWGRTALKGNGVATCWCSVTWGGLPWAYSSSSEIREPRWNARVCCLVERFLGGSLQSHIMGTVGESAGLDHWVVGGLTTISTWNLADCVPTCSAQVVISSSSFAHLRSQGREGYSLAREPSRGTGLSEWRFSNKKPFHLWNLVCLPTLPRQRSWAIALPTAGGSSQPSTYDGVMSQ